MYCNTQGAQLEMRRFACQGWHAARSHGTGERKDVYALTQRGYAAKIKYSLHVSVKSILRLFRIHSSIQLVAIIRSGGFVLFQKGECQKGEC
jgi:hypothetical protein